MNQLAADSISVDTKARSLVDWAAAFVPTARERSARCEEQRQILPETIRDLIDAGVSRIAQPVKFGGFGLGVDVVAEVAMQVGRGCGPTGWMAAQWPAHQFVVGMFNPRAQEEYWASSPDTLSSTVSAMGGTFETVNGGLKVNGHFRFSSGIDAAQWIIVVGPSVCLIPKTDFRIEDDWFVAGLRGSGSKGVHIDGAFVPEHRILAPEAVFEGRTFGAQLYNDPYYQGIPYTLWASPLLVSAIIGMGQGIVDLFEERVLQRKSMQTMGLAKEQAGNQLRFAEATAEVDTARLILRKLFAELREWGQRGGGMPLAERGRVRRDTAYAVKLCLQAANRLYESGDASAIYDASPSQRLVRDLHAAALHVSLTWDEPAMQFSRVRWGLPPQTRLI